MSVGELLALVAERAGDDPAYAEFARRFRVGLNALLAGEDDKALEEVQRVLAQLDQRGSTQMRELVIAAGLRRFPEDPELLE